MRYYLGNGPNGDEAFRYELGRGARYAVDQKRFFEERSIRELKEALEWFEKLEMSLSFSELLKADRVFDVIHKSHDALYECMRDRQAVKRNRDELEWEIAQQEGMP